MVADKTQRPGSPLLKVLEMGSMQPRAAVLRLSSGKESEEVGRLLGGQITQDTAWHGRQSTLGLAQDVLGAKRVIVEFGGSNDQFLLGAPNDLAVDPDAVTGFHRVGCKGIFDHQRRLEDVTEKF